ncbi:DNA topoisomerase 6 subunit B [Cymbomonas tetramitiformis]|uniref:DNA topoisomerase 6 subunit B n=1 Tax=Cymbomonas tetramitiformis TaxID=36881 RepID=A0AAE0FS85_9CHLO|nr:DNA topoisomerase 6 subunit B [Cymbomonas tetramitiformis]
MGYWHLVVNGDGHWNDLDDGMWLSLWYPSDGAKKGPCQDALWLHAHLIHWDAGGRASEDPPVAGGWWLVAGGRWLVAGGRWPVAGGRASEDPPHPVPCAAGTQMVRIHQLFQSVHFDPPDGDCLSPAGEYNLRLGIMKELRPSMVATFEGGVQVHEGHPFIVETGVSLGGRDINAGLHVFRFANRIPLLFEGGNDVAKKAADRIKWDAYKIDTNRDKVGVFVSIVSTKIPFKRQGPQAKRARRALDSDDDSDDDKPPAKDGHILDLVKRNAVTSDMLKEKLTQHIDQMDNDQALDYAMKLGSFKKQQVFLHNVESKNLQPAIHSTTCVISLLKHEALL